MFSYYGSKSKVVDLYPSPKFDKIIEPFSGSARYALKYFDRDVLLVDKYQVIVDVWHYLQQASEKDVLSLPDVEYREKIPLTLSQPERHLIAFNVARGLFSPVTMGHKYNNWKRDKVKISKSLYKIKHWTIKLGSYEEIENQEATWFIDPPYQVGGYKYIESEIDYQFLGNWCQSRNGQIIVCENTKANWLPFYPMCDLSGVWKKSTEAIWSNYPHDFQATQEPLF